MLEIQKIEKNIFFFTFNNYTILQLYLARYIGLLTHYNEIFIPL